MFIAEGNASGVLTDMDQEINGRDVEGCPRVYQRAPILPMAATAGFA